MVRISDPKIQNEPPVSYVLLRKLFSRSPYFFLLEKIFRLINFVCVSCMVRVSVINLKTPKNSEEPSRGSRQPCFFWFEFVYVGDALKTWRPWRLINSIFIWYRNKKIHFCPSGSSGVHEDTQKPKPKTRLKRFRLGLLRSSGNWNEIEETEKNWKDSNCPCIIF